MISISAPSSLVNSEPFSPYIPAAFLLFTVIFFLLFATELLASIPTESSEFTLISPALPVFSATKSSLFFVPSLRAYIPTDLFILTSISLLLVIVNFLVAVASRSP